MKRVGIFLLFYIIYGFLYAVPFMAALIGIKALQADVPFLNILLYMIIFAYFFIFGPLRAHIAASCIIQGKQSFFQAHKTSRLASYAYYAKIPILGAYYIIKLKKMERARAQ